MAYLNYYESKIYNILQVETPTNGEIAKRVYGYDNYSTRGNVRSVISRLRKKRPGTQITATEYGHYRMTKPNYTYMDNQIGAIPGKLGAPRAF